MNTITKISILATCGILLSGCSIKKPTSILPTDFFKKTMAEKDAAKPDKSSVAECATFVAPMPALPLDKSQSLGVNDEALLSYPSTGKWDIQDSGSSISVYNLDKDIDDKIIFTANYVAGTGAVTLDQYADLQLTSLKSSYKSEVLENCATTIGGLPARRIVWVGDQGAFPGVKVMQYIIKKGDAMINTEFSATLKHYDKHVATAQAMAESLKLLK